MFLDYINSTNLKRIDAWLFIIGAGLILNHLTLAWRLDEIQLLVNSLLYWGAACLLIWQKRHLLIWKSNPLSTSIGLFLVSFILIRTAGITGHNFFTRIYPIIALIAWSLLASGIWGIRQYIKESIILCWSILDSTILSNTLNISAITAKFSAYLLWYLGFQVNLQGVNIIMPTGSVEVNSGCSGYTIILQLIGLSIVFLSLFTTPKKQIIILPISAIVMGFLINVVRVALMAVLVAANRQEAFKYWHQEDGSLIFSAIAVIAFSLFFNFLNTNNYTDAEQLEE